MSNFTKLPDGRLLYIYHDPPKIVPGYFRDKNNPNVFIPDYINCKHRCSRDVLKHCPRSGQNKLVAVDYCSLLNKEVSPQICNECDSAEEQPVNPVQV